MKYLKPLLPLLLLLPFAGLAQPQLLSSSRQSIKGTIDLISDELTTGAVTGGTNAKISKLDLALENGDIVITYQLAALEEDHFFEILPTIKLDGQQLLLAKDEFRGDLGRPVPPGSRQIIWLNPLERYVNLEGELEVEVIANDWGEQILPYDCSLGEPSFTAKQKRPYVLAAGLGAAGIGVGLLFRKQRDDAKKVYEESSLADSDKNYQDANQKNHIYLTLVRSGIGILAVDAVWYLIRQGKYKKDLKNWETYCQPDGIGFRPVIELPDNNLRPNGNIGFRMTIPIGRR